MDMDMKCGVIGLGAMGVGMAENLARAGLLHAVWNRSPGKAAAIAAATSATMAGTLEDLAAQCNLIILCVSRDADVLEVIDSLLPAIRADSIVVDCSTVSADTARMAAARLAGSGAAFLDAPVSGGVEGARKGTLAIMAGGEARVLERARPALEAIAAKIVLMGPTGSGQATKAVNQVMAAGINQAVSEALAFAQAMGLDMPKVIDVVGSGAAGNWFLEHRGSSMTQGSYAPGFKLALHYKDLEICWEMAGSAGAASLPVIDSTLRDYQRLIVEGHGEEDISALYRLKSTLFSRSRQSD